MGTVALPLLALLLQTLLLHTFISTGTAAAGAAAATGDIDILLLWLLLQLQLLQLFHLQLLGLLPGIFNAGQLGIMSLLIVSSSPLILTMLFPPCWLYSISTRRLILPSAETHLHTATTGLSPSVSPGPNTLLLPLLEDGMEAEGC